MVGITTAGTTTLTRMQAGIVEVNATAGNIVIELPAPASDGIVYRYEFLRLDASANTVTVATPAGSIVDEPSSSPSILLPASSLMRLICDSYSYIQDGPYVGPAALSSQLSGYVTTAALSADLAGYAALSGSIGEVFNVATATAGTQAVPLSQAVTPARWLSASVNTTWTVPAGITTVLVSGCGGGAGGNPSYSGGAGQFAINALVAVTPGHVLGLSIGSAGVGGTPGATGGGNTVLTDNTAGTTLLTLTGATAGTGPSSGSPSGGGYSAGSTQPGASGPFGGGGPAGGTNSGTVGGAAAGFGAGGGQGQTAAGGNGAPGFLLLRF